MQGWPIHEQILMRTKILMCTAPRCFLKTTKLIMQYFIRRLFLLTKTFKIIMTHNVWVLS